MITRELYERTPGNLPRFLNATLFSANVAFASISLLLFVFPGLSLSLMADLSNRHLSLSSSRFGTAIICWTATLLLASVLWIFQAFLWRTEALRVLLHSVAGFIAVCTPMTFWLCVNTESGWHPGTRFWVGAIELPLALAFASLFQSRRIHFAPFVGIMLLAAHFLLWSWVFGNIWTATYGGPVGSILGFLAGVAWGAQVEADAFSQYIRGTDLPICY